MKRITRSQSLCLPRRPSIFQRNKVCCVPNCGNCLFSEPNKLYFCAPRILNTRQKWLQFAGLDPAADNNVTKQLYFCEDHFDMTKSVIDLIRNRVKEARFKSKNYLDGDNTVNSNGYLAMDRPHHCENGHAIARRVRSHDGDNLSDITILNIKTEMDFKREIDYDEQLETTTIYDYGVDIKEERILTPDPTTTNRNQSRITPDIGTESRNPSRTSDHNSECYNYYLPITQDSYEIPIEFHNHADDDYYSAQCDGEEYNYYSNYYNINHNESHEFDIDMVQIQSIATDPEAWTQKEYASTSETNNEDLYKGIMTVTLNLFDSSFVCCSTIEKAKPMKRPRTRKKSCKVDTVNLNGRSYIQLLFRDKKVHPLNSKISLINFQCRLDRNKSYCVFCKRLFSCYDNLMEHYVDDHLRSLTCNVCNTKFVEKYSLLLHLKLLHTKIKFGSYKCKIPRKTTKPNEIIYMLQCLTCEGTFKLLASIKDHVKETCSGLSKAKYKHCHKCNLFFTKRSYKFHCRWHLKYKHLTRANIGIIQFSKSKCDLSDIKREIKSKRENTMRKPNEKLPSSLP